jgi:hypothetical protein
MQTSDEFRHAEHSWFETTFSGRARFLESGPAVNAEHALGISSLYSQSLPDACMEKAEPDSRRSLWPARRSIFTSEASSRLDRGGIICADGSQLQLRCIHATNQRDTKGQTSVVNIPSANLLTKFGGGNFPDACMEKEQCRSAKSPA